MKRLSGIDILRIIAMYCVICNHTWGLYALTNINEYYSTNIFYIDTILNTLVRISVPLFLMISGYLMLGNDKYNEISNTLTKVKGLLKIIIIWVIIYTIEYYLITDNFSLLDCLKYSLGFITGEHFYYGHLWYLYTTLALYLLTPILNNALKNNKKLIDYLLVLWIIFSIIWPLIYHFISITKPRTNFDLNVLDGYLGYYLLGYKIKVSNNTKSKKFYIVLFISSLVLCLISTLLIDKYLYLDTYLQGFMSPFILIMSYSIFNIFKDININNKLITDLANKSLGIYLVHYMISNYLNNLFLNKLFISNYLYLFITPLCVFIISYIIISILYLNKHIRKILLEI